jgi:hypothetical protein
MKKISAALAVFAMAVTLLVVVPTPALAHGTCARPTVEIGLFVGDPDVAVDAGGFCNTIHNSTTILVVLHRGSKSGPVVFTDSNTVPDSRSAEISILYPCFLGPDGAKYIAQGFLYQRQDNHNQTSRWSGSVTCPRDV